MNDAGTNPGRAVGVIGVPTSAGAFAPGQEQAPRALRGARMIETLRSLGTEVRDHGDREEWRWRPDRAHPRAQNLAVVVEIVRDTALRVAQAAHAGDPMVVLGGDCTVGIGTVAGQVSPNERLGLIYLDAHADLNVPASVPEGALDWMGLAHMLAEPGALPDLVEVGERVPLLDPDQVVVLGWDPKQATDFERDVIRRRAIRTIALDEVAADPAAAATRACEHLDADRLLVHFDVDVIDFTDVPLSENTGRNEGLPYAVVIKALHRTLKDPRLRALTITELNPDHAEEGAGSIERLVSDLAEGLAQVRGEVRHT